MHSVLYTTLKRAGLRLVTEHSLRDSYATALITAHVPVNQIAAYLGHHDAGVTLKVYARFFKNFDDSAIDAVFGPSSGHSVVTSEASNA